MTDNLLATLQNSPLCRRLAEEEILVIARSFSDRRLSARSVVYSEGDAATHLYIVASGQVELSRRSPEGTLRTLARLRNGEMFGEEALFSEGERDHAAVCLDESTLLKFSREDYRRLLEDHPRIAGKLLGVLSDRLRRRPGEADEAQRAATQRVAAFFSAKGGVGRSFLAANFAALAAQAGHKVCLVDLDLQFGNLETFFGVAPARHPWHLDLRIVPSKLLEQFGAVPMDNLRVFMRPRDVTEAERVNPMQVTLLVNHLRGLADLVVLDCRAGFDEATLAALDVSDRVFVVTTGDFAGIAATRGLIGILSQLGYTAAKVQLIHNRASPARDVPVADRAKLFECVTSATIPDEPRVLDALNRSKLFASVAPGHAINEELRRLLGTLLSPHREEPGGTLGFFSRWLGWMGPQDDFRESAPSFGSTHPFSAAGAKSDPRAAMAELALGQAHFLVGKYDVAARALERAVRRDPSCAVAYFYMGEIARFDEDLKAARVFFETALRHAPNNLRYRGRLALVAKAPADLKPELAPLEEFRAAHPEYADIRCLLALLYARRGEDQAAMAELDAALALNPKYVEAMTARGTLSRRSGQLVTALSQLLGVLALNPSYVPAIHELGLLLGDLELWTLARTAHAYALSFYPAHQPSHRRLEEVQEFVRVARREVEAYGEASRLHPRFGDLVFKLGVAHYQLYEFDDARRALARAEECGYDPARVRDVHGLIDRVAPLLAETFLVSEAPAAPGGADPSPSTAPAP